MSSPSKAQQRHACSSCTSELNHFLHFSLTSTQDFILPPEIIRAYGPAIEQDTHWAFTWGLLPVKDTPCLGLDVTENKGSPYTAVVQIKPFLEILYLAHMQAKLRLAATNN